MAWSKFPYPDSTYTYMSASLKKAWVRLHAGDAEPFPKNAALVEAWIAFHAGEFEKAVQLGLAAGVDRDMVANKATVIYANYLEKSEKKKLTFFQEISERCEQQQQDAHIGLGTYHAEIVDKVGAMIEA